jgi:hypothetical protein
MKNKLITDEFRESYKISFGRSFPETERCTGYTTGKALAAIGEAMMNPGKHIDISDEYPLHHQATVLNILAQLKLKFFTIEKNGGHLIYNLFTQ